MGENEYAKIIGKNLKRIAWEQKKTQVQMTRDLGISKATLSSWMNGNRVPRMDKIDMLCKYFNVTRSDIMEPHDYYEPGPAAAAQELFDSDLHALMNAAKGCRPEYIRSAIVLLNTLKETNPDG